MADDVMRFHNAAKKLLSIKINNDINISKPEDAAQIQHIMQIIYKMQPLFKINDNLQDFIEQRAVAHIIALVLIGLSGKIDRNLIEEIMGIWTDFDTWFVEDNNDAMVLSIVNKWII